MQIYAFALLDLQRAFRWPAGSSRRIGLPNGTFDIAISAIKAAKANGFRITTNTTVFEGESPEELRKFFDFVSTLGADGIMVSPGYSYEKAPDQAHFLKRERTQSLFRQVFTGKKWDLNQSKFFIDFLQGKRDYQCTPWAIQITAF